MKKQAISDLEIVAAAEKRVREIHKHSPTDKLCDQDLSEIFAFKEGAKWMQMLIEEQKGKRED